MNEREPDVERICQEALDLAGDARREYVSEACRDDEVLRREVESLLAYEGAAERFIDAPAIEHVARTLAASGTLQAGERIGAYEIISVLGTGGMGEVYRARDTKLRREVAIKVLPQLFLSDVARRARFEQEARTLAALNHPHIATIYGTDESAGLPALVLELVEGETLERLLARSPRRRLPIAKALAIARQITGALESAHEKGIVHLDLKPSNINVSADGRVKVLDFGLATVLGDVDESRSADSPAAGLIVGSPAYMSPEQAQGLPTDRRTDVWAFGCLLFEVLTGKRAFSGDTASATLAQVVTGEPDWSALPESLPAPVSRLLRRCLRKDRGQRLADIADARLEIDESLSAPDVPSAPVVRRWRERAAWTAVALSLSTLAVTVFWMRDEPQPAKVVRFSVDIPGMGDAIFMSLSPDGKQIVYPAITPGGRTGLWVRRLDSLDARLLPGTEDALLSDWSPDSRFIVSMVNQQLKKIDVNGGPPQTLARVSGDVRRTSWSRDGVILFADGRTIRRVADTGGEATVVTELDASLQETNHSTPWFLPDGRHFLYTAWSTNPENRGVYVASLDSPGRTKLMGGDSKAVYVAPGFILFRREGRVMAQPFDAKRLAFSGEARVVAESVRFNPELGQTAFYASGEGTLAYVANTPADVGVAWFDRDGRRQEIGTGLGGALSPALSRDASRMAFHAGATPDIWTYDIGRQQIARLTTDAAADRFPLFSPDGLRVVFASNRQNPAMSGLYDKPSDGATPERIVLNPEPGSVMIPRAWDPEGRYLVFEKGGGFGTPRDIWVLPRSANGKPVPYAASSADERHPALSPDGRWLAYTSNESGSAQIIVQTFPDPAGGRYIVTSGRLPRWSGDGRELYFVDGSALVALSVRTDKTVAVLRTTRLFELPFVPGINDLSMPYDVTADGQRFLVMTRANASSTSNSTEIRVVLNWPSLLQ
jgi:serine/threonine protein kinase/Tol biopolymer transport system component